MGLIALEEAFSLPEVERRLRSATYAVDPTYGEDWERRLPDFTEWRLPEMDAAGIDVQVLSYTVPGLQSKLEPVAAVEVARLATTGSPRWSPSTRTASAASPRCRCRTLRGR